MFFEPATCSCAVGRTAENYLFEKGISVESCKNEREVKESTKSVIFFLIKPENNRHVSAHLVFILIELALMQRRENTCRQFTAVNVNM